MNQRPDATAELFDPSLFRTAGLRVVETLASYLEEARNGELPVLDLREPAELANALEQLSSGSDRPLEDRLQSFLDTVLEHSIHVHHPGYVGHQISVPTPLAALMETLNAFLSNGMTIREMGPIQTAMEESVITRLAASLDLGTRAGGLFTHGGSLGNLTALLAARQAMSDRDTWTEGSDGRLTVLVSDQAHYSIARAVQVMGCGADGVTTVATDEHYRLDLDDLPRAVQRAETKGRRVIGVVASCCSTATGSFDPLEGIAAFCRERELWLHVDGAHGASLALSRKHRHVLEGIAGADSVTWDLHKMLGLPALNTAVLYRDRKHAAGAFAQRADYLFDAAAEQAPEELGQQTFECTKRAMGLTAFAVLLLHGNDVFEHHVDTLVANARYLNQLIEAAPDFESACTPQANIICFRHLKRGLSAEELDHHQARLRESVVRRGSFYLVQAMLRGRQWLRLALMNPLTKESHLSHLLDVLREASSETAEGA